MGSVKNDSERVFKFLGLKDRVHLGLHPASSDHTRMVTYFIDGRLFCYFVSCISTRKQLTSNC